MAAIRASKNIAYICQQVADADTILFPVWQSGIRNPERLANVLSAGIATIVQGGCPSVHDAASFEGASAGLDDMLALVDQLLLRRSTASGPSIFICLGHQLAAASHIRLLQRAVREIGKLARLPLDPSGRVLNSLQRAAERISRMGDPLQVVKQGQPRAIGWQDPDFAVAGNENAPRRIGPSRGVVKNFNDGRTARRLVAYLLAAAVAAVAILATTSVALAIGALAVGATALFALAVIAAAASRGLGGLGRSGGHGGEAQSAGGEGSDGGQQNLRHFRYLHVMRGVQPRV